MRVNWNLVWTKFSAIAALIAILALTGCEEPPAPLETAAATAVFQRIPDTPSPAPSLTSTPSPTSLPSLEKANPEE